MNLGVAILQRSVEILNEGRTAAAFDYLYEHIDKSLFGQDFVSVNSLIQDAAVNTEIPLKLLVGILTITLPFKDALSDRPHLVESVRARAFAIGGEEKVRGVLSGLE